jgi:sugar/nucleoside kinase (ribokinase family)
MSVPHGTLRTGGIVTGQQQSIACANDFVVAGELFLDVVFADLDSAPEPGTEVFAGEKLTAPGGIANVAFALARLRTTPRLISEVGKDVFGQWLRSALLAEKVDLSIASEAPDTSITVSIADSGERSMVTFSPQQQAGEPKELEPPKAIILDLGSVWAVGGWWKEAAANGARIYADIRWEGTDEWRERTLRTLEFCSVFTPNTKEALFLTGESSVEAAAEKLANFVDLVAVTAGEDGVFTYESGSGRSFWTPSIEVDVRDTTGAGDVFLASFARAEQSSLPLADCVAFAALCSGLSVTKMSGSFGAPTLDEIEAWQQNLSERHRETGLATDLSDRYAFLSDYLRVLLTEDQGLQGSKRTSEGLRFDN